MIGVDVSIQKRNQGTLDAIIAKINAACRYDLQVGYVGTKASEIHVDSKKSNAQLAAIHEFGSPSQNLPSRPFLWKSFIVNVSIYNLAVQRMIRYIAQRGPSVEESAWHHVGNTIVTAMKETLERGSHLEPPLTEKRIRIKTRCGYKDPSRPLMATQQMFEALDYKVVPK